MESICQWPLPNMPTTSQHLDSSYKEKLVRLRSLNVNGMS